jgi:hypothetical protein
MSGVFAVAEQLSLKGWIVSPTSRNAEGVDLLMTKGVGEPLAGQVKTNGIQTSDGFWLVGKNARKSNSSLFYFFVKFHSDGRKDVYVVPSRIVSKKVYSNRTPRGVWYAIDKPSIVKFKNRYELLDH